MRRNLLALLALSAMFTHGMQAHAVCSAGNPNATVAETTPDSDFTNNGDGTVTHNKTGLMWKQCVEGKSGAGCTAGTPSAFTWADALTAAASANTAGYTDWRVPNKKELESIVELCGYQPAINQNVFPGTPSNNFLWSSTTYLPGPTEAWTVTSGNGGTGTELKSIGRYFRLVRNGQLADSFDVLKIVQTISFGSAPTVAVGGTGSVSATGGASGNPVVFTSASPSVCTIVGATVTGVSGGTCTIAANQAGNASYNAAAEVRQDFTIDPSAPTATTTAATAISATGATLNGNINANGATTAVSFEYGTTVAYGTNTAATPPSVAANAGSTVALAISSLGCNTVYHFRVKGVNSAGTTNGGDLSFTTSACPGTVPGAPTINTATPGQGRATIGFSPPASNGGSPITGYTATCVAGGQITRFMNGAGSPITVGGLAGGVQYSCSVAAKNGVGTGASSGSLVVTPLLNSNGRLIPVMMLLLLD